MRKTAIIFWLAVCSFDMMAQTFFINPPKNRPVYVIDGTWANGDTLHLDKEPEFPGGRQEMYNYLYTHVTVSMIAADEIASQGGGGTLIKFELDAAGRVGSCDIIRSNTPSLEFQFTRAIENMPQWQPAEADGISESILVYLPLIYNVQNNVLVFDEGSGKAIVGRSKENSWLKGVLIAGTAGLLAALFFLFN